MTKFYTSVCRYGNQIQVRGYENGKRIKKSETYSPTLFFTANPEKSTSPYRTLDDKQVEPISFPTMAEAKDFIKTYDNVPNAPIYGTTNYIHQYIAYEYPKNIEYDFSLIRIHSIDIETAPEEGQTGFPHPDKAEQPITAITVYDSVSNTYHVWSTVNWDSEKSIHKNIKIDYNWFMSEKELLMSFVSFWHDEFTCPDIITGWNIRTFDIPYIVNRIIRVLGDSWVKKISPWKRIDERMISIMKRQVQTYEIAGVSQLDYLDLFKKFAYTYGPQESYKLDHIASVVLGENKLSYEEFGNLRTLHLTHPQILCDYNIRDVEIISKLEDKLGLIALACNMVYKAGSSFGDVFGTTAIWDALIHRYLLDQKIVVPPNEQSFKREFEGAYVKEPLVGVHDWVCSFDIASLYPNIIVQWNMSPETILFGEKQDGVSVNTLLNGDIKCERDDAILAATGQYFSKKKKGFLPAIIEEMYAERQSIKKGMLKAKQEKEQCDRNDKSNLYRIEREIARLENNQMTLKILNFVGL